MKIFSMAGFISHAARLKQLKKPCRKKKRGRRSDRNKTEQTEETLSSSFRLFRFIPVAAAPSLSPPVQVLRFVVGRGFWGFLGLLLFFLLLLLLLVAGIDVGDAFDLRRFHFRVLELVAGVNFDERVVAQFGEVFFDLFSGMLLDQRTSDVFLHPVILKRQLVRLFALIDVED